MADSSMRRICLGRLCRAAHTSCRGMFGSITGLAVAAFLSVQIGFWCLPVPVTVGASTERLNRQLRMRVCAQSGTKSTAPSAVEGWMATKPVQKLAANGRLSRRAHLCRL